MTYIGDLLKCVKIYIKNLKKRGKTSKIILSPIKKWHYVNIKKYSFKIKSYGKHEFFPLSSCYF